MPGRAARVTAHHRGAEPSNSPGTCSKWPLDFTEERREGRDRTSSRGRGSGYRPRWRGAAVVDMKLEGGGGPGVRCGPGQGLLRGAGGRLDADFPGDGGFRVVQLTPPGSACSIIFGSGVTSAAPGSTESLQLVVTDIETARAEVVDRGVEVSEVFHDTGGVFHRAGTAARAPGPAPEHKSYGSFASFSDPDGNGWFLQEVTTRLPGQVSTRRAETRRVGRFSSEGDAPMPASYDSAINLAAALRRSAESHGRHEEASA